GRLQRRLIDKPAQRVEVSLFLIGRQKGCLERIARQRDEVRAAQLEGGGGRLEGVTHIPAEVGGIIGVHRDHEPSLQQLLQVVLLERRKDPQLYVRQRADRKRNLFLDQTADQSLVLCTANAMIDAAGLERIERFPDVGGRHFL